MIRLSSVFMSSPKSPLGQILVTPGALEALGRSHQNPLTFIARHSSGDWGIICDEDQELNDQAVVDGSRIVSAYHVNDGTKLWVITEAANDDGHRSATTILLPDEY